MGRGWQHKVKIRHLFTDKDDCESVQASMNAIADVIAKDPWFRTFVGLHLFRQIPQGDSFFAPTEYANKLLDRLYDYADDQRIWIE